MEVLSICQLQNSESGWLGVFLREAISGWISGS